ncbi:MAG TPA: Gfo/Idh/MocA family oxidoreductase [Opitutus sp.]|nr:Gfo/Idh/MocA family oxidoreductase [Opitutus sp.]
MNQQRILLAGFGFMGEMHAQAVAGLEGAGIAAVVDAVPEAARRKAERLGLAVPVYADLERALQECDAGIVDVCLPTPQHAPAAIRALAAGRHVFCEKPVALSVAEAREIAAAHARSRAFFQVGHCIRFWPEYQAFEQFVRGGTAGRLRSLTLQRRSARPGYSVDGWLNDPRRSLGAAVDLHIHDTDFVLHLLGEPAAVESRGTRDAEGWNHIFTDYAYPDLVVQAEGGWNYPAKWGFQMAFQAVFEDAAIEYDSRADPTLRLTRAGGAPAPLPFVPAGGAATGTTGNLSSLGGYANELRYFLDRVASGVAPEIATLPQAIRSLDVVLAEVKSAETGRAIAIGGTA